MFGNLLLADFSIIGMLVGTKEMVVNVFSSSSSAFIIIILTLLGGMFYLIVGATAGSAVFGDLTSPISDTTIMSCSSTGCDVVSHAKTQLPYTLCFAAAACVLYLVVGFIL